MTALVASDLHLNSRWKDRYRWEIMEWLDRKGDKLGVDLIIVCGDLTDDKDRHTGELVNRIVDFLHNSRNQWVFVSGNHDYANPNSPFFGFLNCLQNVRWITKPRTMKLAVAADYTTVLLLPATKDWATEWPRFFQQEATYYEYIFMHGTFEGTLSETGYPLPGIPRSFFDPKLFGRVFAGDVHVPGEVAPQIESVGSPYRVRFGDAYEPRVLHIGESKVTNINPNLTSRHVLNVRQPEDFDKFPEVYENDQVKLRVRMRLADMVEWREVRKTFQAEAEQRGWEVHGIEPIVAPVRRRLEDKPEVRVDGSFKTPQDYIREFATKLKLKRHTLDFGLRLLNS